MKTQFLKSFERDLRKIKDRSVLESVGQAIQEVEAASSLQEIKGLKKLSGSGDYFRIRIGDFRIGIVMTEDEVQFVRCLHRREI